MEEDWLVKLVRLTIYHNGTIDYKAMSSSFFASLQENRGGQLVDLGANSGRLRWFQHATVSFLAASSLLDSL